MQLKNRTALVTGSTSGIGLSVATKLAQMGSNIILHGSRDIEKIRKTAKEIETTYKVDVFCSSVDMTDTKSIDLMIEQSLEKFGAIDILVNNVGIGFNALIEDTPPEKWEQVISLNLSSCFYTMRGIVPGMRKNKWGRIINMASALGKSALPYRSAYVASKHGLIGLTKVVALETAEENITCNAVCPGYVKTDLVTNLINKKKEETGMSADDVHEEFFLKVQPNKKFIDVTNISDCVGYLCSESAAGITGAAFSIDGGWTAK